MSTSEAASGIQNLYPFLYAGESNLESVLEEVRKSTVEKAIEIVELRRRVAEELGPRLAACAAAMAARFNAGGLLFTFGNGGYSNPSGACSPPLLPPTPRHAPPPLSP